MWQLFSSNFFVEMEVAILKYENPLYFLKSSVRSKKRSPHVRARSLAPSCGAKGADMRHLHETLQCKGRAAPAWMVCRNLAPHLYDYLFSLLRHHHSYSNPIVCMHWRSDEQVSGTLIFVILHCEKANKVFGKCSSCDSSQILHDGSSSVGCSGTSYSSSPSSWVRQREHSTAADQRPQPRSIIIAICMSTNVEYIYNW